MTLFQADFPATLASLSLPPGTTAEIWSFDDAPTRRAATARLAAQGVHIRCHSAYKPLICAFRDDIATDGLTHARIVWPRHPAAPRRRFLLESYPLSALHPATTFEFVEGGETDAMPAYHLTLSYADGRVMERTVLAPNRVHHDYAGNLALSPCGWLIRNGVGAALETDYEAIFHRTMRAVAAAPLPMIEPFFQELNIAVTLPALDEPLTYDDEALSLSEALHEDFYFSLLELFQRRSGREQGDRRLQPGQIVPEIRQGPTPGVIVTLRPHDARTATDYHQPLETAGRALSTAQIADELDRIPGTAFNARAVSGRMVHAVHHHGSDRPVIISGGQHANETTAPVGVLRAAHRLAARPGAHFTVSPLENPDGYALHQRLVADNARHMHHAARYTALGDDLHFRDGAALYEKAIRIKAAEHAPALLHLNLHGYPAHEWTRPLSGYIPRGFEVWTLPKGFFLVMRYRTGWADAAHRLMDSVTRRLNDVPGLRAFNDAQIALFERHAGETGFQMLNGFPVLISEDERPALPMELITEYPDETIYDDAFRAGHTAQMAAILAAYDALQELDAGLFLAAGSGPGAAEALV